MSIVKPRGFARLDFEEIKCVGAMTGFDIKAHARTKRSCGPGCDYLVQDKRYYTLLLLQHIENMMQAQSRKITPKVMNWLTRARAAASEYADIERTMRPDVRREQKG
jgi:hypothetical protein